MKIEQGKFYRTRGGEKVEVVKTGCRGGKIVIYDDYLISSYMLYGNGCFYTTKFESEFDLIEEWTDPVEIPWDDYPTWMNFMAMDSDGRWCLYSVKPYTTSSHWDNSDGQVATIPKEYEPKNFTGSWKESLFVRV